MKLTTAVPHAHGATGRVLRARDEASGRAVAIKVLRADDPLWVMRMARESNALKRLRHPHICPILAVTEYNGQPAIVLPFIDGDPIDRALADADLKTRLAVMRDVIAAVHAAHHDGIIHRDLKPGNVLVEWIDGHPHAWVLDFGLARQETDETVTVEGQILGTPGYLSPEQAQGRSADERSDVYSLGVMLFQLLTGRLPHPGETAAELLLAAVSRDAPSVRTLDPRIPVPVARVVQKCLERKPSLRYRSALELHDDLLAVSEGRNVRARGIGPVYQLRRRLLHSPLLSVALATAMLATLGAAWVSWRSDTRQQAVVAQGRALEQRVLAVERDLQLIYMKPTHDIRAEVAAVTELALREAGNLAQVTTGPVAAAAQAAIGRLHLAIGNVARAVQPLERAWYAGLRDPQVTRSLGEAHTALFLEALADIRRQRDEAAYADALAMAEQAHAEPARRFLGTVDGADPLSAALLARLDGDPTAALAALDIGEDPVWPVPAWLLSLRLLLDEASRLLHAGETEAMATMIDRARPLAARLTDRVRSHPEAWRLACRLDDLEVALAMTGREKRDLSLAACEGLGILDPDRLAHRVAAAGAFNRLSRYRQLRAEDPRSAIGLGLAWLGDVSGSPEVDGLRGALLFSLANYRQQVEGKRSIELLQQSATSLRNAVAADPDNPAYLSDLAATLRTLGTVLYAEGGNGDTAFSDAVTLMETAAERHPSYLFVHRELISLLTWQGYERYLRGREAQALLDKAIGQSQAAIERWPDSAAIYAARGMAARTLAEYRLQAGGDPSDAARVALAAFDRCLELQPGRFSARFNQSGIPIFMARHALRSNQSPGPWIEMLDQQLEGLIAQVVDPDEVSIQVGLRHMLAARAELAQGRWPETEISRARERLTVALASDWDRMQAQLAVGELAMHEHRVAAALERLDRDQLRTDLETLTGGLDESPEFHELRLQRAELIEFAREVDLDAPACEIDPVAERNRAIAGNPLLAAAYP